MVGNKKHELEYMIVCTSDMATTKIKSKNKVRANPGRLQE